VFVLEKVFDGIFEGDDVSAEISVQVIKGGSEGGGFSRSGGAGDENEAGAALSPAAEKLVGEAEGIERGDEVFDGANGGAEFAHGAVEIDAEIVAGGHEVAGVAFVVSLGIDAAGLPKGGDVVTGHFGVFKSNDFAVDAEASGLFFGEKDVGGVVIEPM